MAPVEERTTQLCGDGWELHDDVTQPDRQSQTDSVEQLIPSGELMDMRSQLQPSAGNLVDEATNAGDGAPRAADRAMQASDDDQAARIPAAGAWVQGNGGAEDGGARHNSALGTVGRVTGQLAAQVCDRGASTSLRRRRQCFGAGWQRRARRGGCS